MTDERKQVVIIGGGAIGLSIAYHLGRLGIEDVLLLERHQLTSGTSWHAAGIVGPLRASMNLTRLASYAMELFAQLENETGQATGYRQTGGVWLAQTTERMLELARIKAMGDRNGLHTAMLQADAISERLPLLNTADLAGGLWVDEDGQVNPVDLCMAYASAARSLGVEIREHCMVDKIETCNAEIKALLLQDGSRIECRQLVLAAGAWSRSLARQAGVDLPLIACEHMYLVTDLVQNLPRPCPIIRDLDSGIYLKGDSGKLVLGAFEKNPKPWISSPQDAPFLMFDEDWDHVQPMLEAGITRVPQLAEQGITHFMNGPESFTPDTRQLMGETPACKNLFVAAGFNSIGIMSSAGVGKVMAQWILERAPPMDLWEVDVARVDPLQSTDGFLQQRLGEAVHNQFDMHWPYKQFVSGRGLRRSCWHQKLARNGAVFGAPTGWERPLWFAREAHESEFVYSYGDQNWWPATQREVLHCQRAVSLFDLSPFSKFEISGSAALDFLQQLCCGDVDISCGRVLYTLMLNPRGGIEAEVTLARLASDRFRIISGAATRFKDLFWLRRNYQAKTDVLIRDITEDYAALGLMGPNSRGLMQALSDHDFDDRAFPFSSVQAIEIDDVSVCAVRLSYAGELGWELYLPVSEAEPILDRIMTIGVSHQLGLAGHFALDSCRLEKGYRHWGHDIGLEDTPFEAGLEFAVNFDKPTEFNGKQALLQQKHQGWKRQLRLCEVLAESVLILHDEPVYAGSQIVGHCTSGGSGFRTGKILCFVMFYQPEQSPEPLEIEIAGERFALKILRQPPYRTSCQ